MTLHEQLLLIAFDLRLAGWPLDDAMVLYEAAEALTR
jgi:hypothetical protein